MIKENLALFKCTLILETEPLLATFLLGYTDPVAHNNRGFLYM